MYFRIDDENHFKMIKTEDYKNIEWDTLVYDNRYIKTKWKIYGDKFYTNFHGWNVLEDDAKYKSFTITSIRSLLL